MKSREGIFKKFLVILLIVALSFSAFADEIDFTNKNKIKDTDEVDDSILVDKSINESDKYTEIDSKTAREIIGSIFLGSASTLISQYLSWLLFFNIGIGINDEEVYYLPLMIFFTTIMTGVFYHYYILDKKSKELHDSVSVEEIKQKAKDLTCFYYTGSASLIFLEIVSFGLFMAFGIWYSSQFDFDI